MSKRLASSCSVVEKGVPCPKPGNGGGGMCSMHYARLRKHGTTSLPKATQNPGWGRGKPRGGKWWTKRRVLAALQAYAVAHTGSLPSSSDAWHALKKGDLTLPPAAQVTRLFKTFARAWIAAGVPREKVTLQNSRWSPAELEFLLKHAGTSMTLEQIARRLNRSYQSVRNKIGGKGLKITARANQGYMSAAQVAKEYGCSYTRVIALLQDGRLRGRRLTGNARRTYLIDPADLTPAVQLALKGDGYAPVVEAFRRLPAGQALFVQPEGSETLLGIRLGLARRLGKDVKMRAGEGGLWCWRAIEHGNGRGGALPRAQAGVGGAALAPGVQREPAVPDASEGQVGRPGARDPDGLARRVADAPAPSSDQGITGWAGALSAQRELARPEPVGAGR